MNLEWFEAQLNRLGLKPDPRFEAFEADLYTHNEVMNLTRIPRDECALRHFVDSLLFADLIPESAEVLDIGCGPGFPSWPLAVCRPDLMVTAMDSSGKMLSFLIRHPLPNLIPLKMRAEECGFEEGFDVVTGRAIAPFAAQLELSAVPCKVGGAVIPMRTPNDEESINKFPYDKLGLKLESLEKLTLADTDTVRWFPILRKVAPTPTIYPRMWGEIKRRPLA